MSGERRTRVMIAEDDAPVREALSAVIGSESRLELVGAAADANEAIEMATREQPDVALLDVRMPGGGGPHAARGLAECSPNTNVVALSASEDRAAVLEMLEAGAVGYLVKGSPISSIIEAIEQAAQGYGSLSAEVTGGVINELVEQLSVRRRRDDRRRRRKARIQRAIKEPAAFGFVFQPIFKLDGGACVGTEALARFRGPPRRTPDRWFSEADEVGLRVELELAAIARALEELPSVGPSLFLSLNASPETVTASRFRELVTADMPERLVLEITEYAQVHDYDALNAALSTLRRHGIRLAVDDAGAGFASLRHILRLEPDFIKLDRSLIAGIQQDRSQQALASGLISFAAKIGATIIAEGIERDSELAALHELGVQLGQGYFLARPAPLSPAGNGSPEVPVLKPGRKRRARVAESETLERSG